MGAYINPANESKEAFLRQHGEPVTRDAFLAFDYADKSRLPVCLVDNGAFTAAGIAYDARERACFVDSRDMRRKAFFLVPLARLQEVSRELSGYMERVKQ